MEAPPGTPAPDPVRSTMLDRLKTSWNDPAKRPALAIGFGAVGLAIVLLVVALTQINPPPPAVTPTPTTECRVNCGPGPQIEPVTPKVLQLRDRQIFIAPVNIDSKGNWAHTSDSDKAEWVYGTLINYVVGLAATQDNNDMLEALSEADAIELGLSNGSSLKFRYAGRQFVSPTSTDVFAQQRPGLTLVLIGENSDQRLVVNADYVSDFEVGQAVPSTVAQINTPIELGGVRVTVLSGRLVYNAPGLPVGSAFYLVDFTAENVGSDALAVDDFFVELQDYASVKYPVSADASALGPNPAPKGQLLPGIAATFTAGFQVPTNVTGPVLVWNFKPSASFKAQASVAVPLIGPTPTPDPRSQVTVQVTQAYFSLDQSEMIIVGGVGNASTAAITLNPSDVSLSTPDGVFAALNSSEPLLPTTLQPGQNQTFTWRFSRLPSTSSVFRVFQIQFQLNW